MRQRSPRPALAIETTHHPLKPVIPTPDDMQTSSTRYFFALCSGSFLHITHKNSFCLIGLLIFLHIISDAYNNDSHSQKMARSMQIH